MLLTAIEVVTLALLPLSLVLAAIMLVRLWSLPASPYLAVMRIMVALVFPGTLCIYLTWFALPTSSYAYTVTKTLGLLIFQVMVFLLILAQLELLTVLAPFIAGIRPQYILAAQVVTCGSALGVCAATAGLLFSDAFVSSYLLLVLCWNVAVGIFDTSMQLFLLYFVLYKLKDVSVRFRMQYVALIATNAAVLTAGGVHFVLSMSFEVQSLAFSGAAASIYSAIAAESVQILRTSLQSPTRAVKSGAKPATKKVSLPAGAAAVAPNALSRRMLDSTDAHETPPSAPPVSVIIE